MKKMIIKILTVCVLGFSFIANPSFAKSPRWGKTDTKQYNIVILGGGIGALTSGIYLARAGYNPIIIEGSLPGGLITQSHSVENWPGEMKISGNDLADKIRDQAEKNGCIFLAKEVINVDFSKRPFTIKIKDVFFDDQIETIKANSCIIAMGTSSNYLNVTGEKDYWGRGVSNCAVCDGTLYKNKTVAVIGGSDAAITEANYLSKIAKKVFVILRKQNLKAVDMEKLKVLQETRNIEIINNTIVNAVKGDRDNVQALSLKNVKNNKKSDIAVDGIFLAIGSKPNSSIFKNKLKLDRNGYINVAGGGETSIDGVFALGDIVDPIYKQAITAAGDGAKAAIAAQHYLEKFRKSKHERKDFLIPPNSVSSVVHVKSLSQLNSELKEANTPVIIDFYATWCKPCQRIAPLIEYYAKKLDTKVKILKVNVSKTPAIAAKYKISAMPTIVVLDKKQNLLFKKLGPKTIVKLFSSLEKKQDQSVDEINKYLISME